METFREQAAERLADMAEELEMLKDALRVDVTYDDLPDFIIPEPEINMPPSAPLLDSSWSFVDQCRALKGAKSYDEGDPS